MSLRTLFYCFTFFFFISYSLHSQVVNIEKKRTAAGKSGLQGNVDLTFNMVESASSILQGKSVVKLQYFKNNHLFLFLNDFTLTQVNGNKYLNDGYQHFRYNYKPDSLRIIPEAFVQYQYNTVRKLDRRLIAGGGPRFKLAARDTFRLFVGPLFMYENELLTNDTVCEAYRMSLYVSTGFNFNKWLAFNTIAYYQPNLADFNDYRLSGEASLTIRITDKLAMKSLIELLYDTRPPVGIKDLFYSFTTGISFVF